MAQKKLLELGQDLEASLEAFSEAHYGAPRARIIREALKFFIDFRLQAEPEMRKRYDDELAKRKRGAGQNIHVLDAQARAK